MKRLLEEDTICRLCLRIDEKAYKITNTSHKTFIESIIKLKNNVYILPDDLYVCYICKMFLAKLFNFAQTVWNAQEIVCELLKTVDIITKPMLDRIDRHSNGLNPITLTSVVTYGNNIINKSGDDGLYVYKSTGIKEVESIDTEEVDVKVLVDKTKKNTKKGRKKNKQKRKTIEPKNPLGSNSSSDENEATVTQFNVDEEEVEIGNIDKETSDIFVDRIRQKPKRRNLKIEMNENLCVTTTPNEKEYKDESDEIVEDYDSDSRRNTDKDYCPDSTSHSEDSEYDSFDDEGKPIKRPKDTRVYPMKCDHCDFVVPEKLNHYRHYQYEHPDVEYPYRTDCVACMVCGKLVNREKIRVHEETHFPTRSYRCSVCPNKVFPTKVKLYRHFLNVHPKKTFTCDYCSKVFKTKTDFHRHIRIHTGNKPYKCHICDAAFAHSGNRQIHLRIKHQNYKDKPKDNEKPQKKRKKNTHYSVKKEVYDTSDDEPLVGVATNPQRMSETPSGDSKRKPKKKCKKQGPIQNGIGGSKAKS